MAPGQSGAEGEMKLRTPADFGAVIRDRRIERGMKQADLARMIGVGREWVVALEKGKPGAHLGLVLRAMNALGLSTNVRPGERPVAAPGKNKRSGKQKEKRRRQINIDGLLDGLRNKKP